MQATDTHQRYFHPHYVVTLKLFIQANGSILIIQGNMRLEVNPDELLSMLDGVIELAKVYGAISESNAPCLS